MENTSILIHMEDREAFGAYLYERENARATVEKYLTDIKTFFRYMGEKRVADKKSLLLYKEWLLEHYAVSSVNSMLAALNQFLTFRQAPELRVKQVKVQRRLFLKEEREMTKAEYKRLIRTAQKAGKAQLALCMETIAATGIRISELQYFTVENMKKGRIEIFNKGKYRRIFLSEKIRKKLLLYCQKRGISRGCIFITRNGKPKNRSNLWKEMKALKKKAGVRGEKIFPHNFRHLFARIYYAATKDMAGLADLLGHSNLNITRIYTSGTGEIYQKQLNRIPLPEV